MIITTVHFFHTNCLLLRHSKQRKQLQTVWSTGEAQRASCCRYFHNKYIQQFNNNNNDIQYIYIYIYKHDLKYFNWLIYDDLIWKIFINIINVFTVIIGQFNALQMNKSINDIKMSIYQRTLKKQKHLAAQLFLTYIIIRNVSWTPNQHIRTISEGVCMIAMLLHKSLYWY